MKLKTEMQAMIEKGQHEVYLDLAKELLEENASEPEQILAALMRYALKDTLAEGSYREIGTMASSNVGHNDKARLFVARGHEDNMNADQIAQFLASETGVDKNGIGDIRVFDKFTFITVSPADADMILATFAKVKGRNKPLVTRAKEKPQGGFGGGGFGGGGGRGNFERRDGGSRPSRGNFNDGGFKRGGDRPERPSRPEGDRSERPVRHEGERPVRREFAASDKPAEKKPYEKKIADKGVSDFIPKKRSNKMTDYLEKGDPAVAPAKKDTPRKESFKVEFKDDDLNW
jgi:hypothetical protein